MTIDDRIRSLVIASDRGTVIERELRSGKIIEMAQALTSGIKASTTAPPLVVFDSGRTAFFKRFHDQDPNLCKQYRQDAREVPLNEVAAWRLALEMGDPWSALVPTAVLRQIKGFGGALINDQHARVDPSVFDEAPRQVMAAGLWDALIGNQDRNARNYRYDSQSRRLALIDHGFVFARPGDPSNESMFFAARRRMTNGVTISDQEHEALGRLLESGDLHGLRMVIPGDRADALENRAKDMFDRRCLPAVTAF